MKEKRLRIILKIFIAVAVCGFFLFFLLKFTQPLSTMIYDLSVSVEDGKEWNGDTNGWSFYCEDKNSNKTKLTLDSGCSCVLPSQGITFAYSRVMTETLRIPQLNIELSNCNIAVLLNGVVLYNDCPDIDVTLPGAQLESVDWDRFENVSIPLPKDYEGKTLTILQSTPSFSEIGGQPKGYLCGVTLSNDRAEDSSFISSGYTLSIHALLLFIAGAVTLCGCLFRKDEKDYSYAVLSMTAFFQLVNLLSGSGYWNYYIGSLPFDITYLSNELSVLALLVFLTLRINKRSRLLWGVCGGELIVLILQYIFSSGTELSNSFLGFSLPVIFSCCALLCMYICTFSAYRRKDMFFRAFLPTLIIIVVIWTLSILLLLPFGSERSENAIKQIKLMLTDGTFNYLLYRLHLLGLISSVISTFICFIRMATHRHAKMQFIKDRSDMAMASYQQLRESDNAIMMIHHDIRHHLSVLSEMDNLEDSRAYIQQLIGQEHAAQTFLRSGNDFLDTILNGKLSGIDRENINLEVVRCHAPEKFKLTDAELCSVMMNVIENAVNGARASGAENPFIRLDLHVKDDVFVCTVENSAKPSENSASADNPPELLPLHGWGLHIIRQIMDRYGYPMDARQKGDVYKVMLTILCEPNTTK